MNQVFIVERHPVTLSSACRSFLSYALRIVAYGSVQTGTTDPRGERFNGYHRLNYILAGNPTYPSGNKIVSLEPGCLVYLAPGMTLEIDPNKEPVSLLFINFEVGALDLLEDFNSFMDSLFPDWHVHDNDGDLLEFMEAIARVGRENRLGAALEIQNLFEVLFLHIVRLSDQYQPVHDTPAPAGSTEILNQAMNYINGNLNRNFRIGELAEALNISENYLYKVFVSRTGKSPTAFLAALRMDIAKQSLANHAMPVKVIAAHLGYPDVSHFSNAFKKAWGISPRAYRNSLIAKPPLQE